MALALRIASRGSKRASPALLARHAGGTGEATPLERTALHALHLELGGKMVPFAGYELPVQYPAGVLREHLHTRAQASLFDVGHMGQIAWHGADRVRFLETLVVADVAALAEFAATLTVMTTAEGGILDDSIITNIGSGLHYMVVNGATKHRDLRHFDEQLAAFKGDARYEFMSDRNLMALQGPAAVTVLAALVDGGTAAKEAVHRMPFMSGSFDFSVAGRPCSVVRCGYTGEDGFEISVVPKHAEALARAFLADARVQPAGLGARDSLRLEAGLCLYGHDMDDKTTPNEAALSWVIPKSRRDPTSLRATFLGARRILSELASASWARRRVGLTVQGAPAREGSRIFAAGAPVGVVTSGTFSPCLKAPIAMGYVPPALAVLGTALHVEVRGKLVPATVAKMPFVPTNYYRGGK